MFGKSTDEQISKELLTTYKAWDHYVSAIWASILDHSNLPKQGIIAEIAPGSSPKIAYALQKINFSGEIYLIEPYQSALELITRKYSELLPKATLHPLNCLLSESIELLPQNLDCIIAHHCLDDMMMAMDADPQLFEQLFSWVNQDKLEIHPKFAAHWQQLDNNPTRLNHVESEIIKQWIVFVNQMQPKMLMMSQYPSLVLETTTMNSLNRRAQYLLQQLRLHFHSQLVSDLVIQDLLNINNNYNFDLIGNEVLNSQNWLIYKKRDVT